MVKRFFFFVAFLMFCCVSASALDVVDNLDGVLVVVNDGRPVPAYDGVVTADQLSSADSLAVSTALLLHIYLLTRLPLSLILVLSNPILTLLLFLACLLLAMFGRI